MIAAMLGFAAAALTIGFVPDHPAWWRAAVSLAVLGGIAPMIYAVNIRVVPVFSRRPWASLGSLRAQVALLLAGAWIVYAGRMNAQDRLIQLGSLLALASGLLFIANVVRLFKQPPSTPAPPTPFPNQVDVDKLAVKFTRWAGIYLQIGLIVGVVTAFWQPERGRWDLVWAHAMLVGFMLSMAAGTSYHVLSRWTGYPWKSTLPIRLHLIVMTIGLPVMLLALATDSMTLFKIAGPLQAAAIVLFLAEIAPLVLRMPRRSKPAMVAAAVSLAIGVCMGAWFAIEAAAGARLRLAHAEINLFGWTGLLICGVGYYLIPRLAGHPLRWPRLANIQLVVLGAGILIGAVALVFRGYGHMNTTVILGAQLMVSAGFILFALIIGGTFVAKSSPVTVSAIQIGKRPQTVRNAGS
jgi:hypothetical protein